MEGRLGRALNTANTEVYRVEGGWPGGPWDPRLKAEGRRIICKKG